MCEYLYNKHFIKTIFGSSLPLVVCMMVHVLFTFLRLFAYSGVKHILCSVFVLFFFVLCVPYIASFSGLSIFYCPFGILLRLFLLIKIHANILCETIANSYWYLSSNICSFLQTTHIKKSTKKVTLFTL